MVGGSRSDRAGMKAVQVVASLENAAAGPSYSVARLAEALAGQGVESRVMSTGAPGCAQRGGARFEAYRADYANAPVLRALKASRALARAIDAAAANGAILHAHGLWLMPNVYPAEAARRHGAPLVLSPRGMLAPRALQFSRAKKAVFSALAQTRTLRAVACFHATADSEVDDVRVAGYGAPVAVLPNGVDIPPQAARPNGPQRTMLYLGRVHPKKGLDQLLEAWAWLESTHPDWRLRIVGPSEIGHGEVLQAQAGRLGLERVTFEAGLFGDARLEAYREADVFVLPTLSENFGMVVAEALAAGTPVICSKGAPWAGLETERCGWWTDHGAEALAGALGEAMARPRAELAAMGARGRDWMIRDFSWAGVAVRMARVYAWLKAEEDRPPWVRLA